MYVLSENDMTTVERRMEELAPRVMVVDSIQTMYLPRACGAAAYTGGQSMRKWIALILVFALCLCAPRGR